MYNFITEAGRTMEKNTQHFLYVLFFIGEARRTTENNKTVLSCIILLKKKREERWERIHHCSFMYYFIIGEAGRTTRKNRTSDERT